MDSGRNSTMLESKRKGAAGYWAAGFIVACYLAHTANCHRPKETVQRRGATIGVRDGTIVFGRGVESHVANGDRKAQSNASAVEDERAYQVDFPGWSIGKAQDISPIEAAWKRIAPSLQCGRDQMRFRAVGPGASKFALDRGNAPPMHLSQVPSNCGYTMQRNSLALVMMVPYDGCNIVQEGGSYMLPMRWQEAPLSLWCNKPAEHPPATTPAPAPTSAQPQDPKPMFPVYPSFNSHYHSYPPGPLPTPADPTTTTTEPTTTQSQVPKFPQMPKFPPHGHQMPQFPPYGHFQQFPYYHRPMPTPAEPTITTQKMMTEPTPTQSEVPQVPHFPQMPKFPPYGHQMPQFPPYGQFQQFPHYPMPLPTPADPTTQSQVPHFPHFPPYGPQMPHFPPYGPCLHYPHYPMPLPTPADPTTTQSQVPLVPHFPQLPEFPHFPPYGPAMPQIPYGYFPPHPFFSFIPPPASKNPTSMPETTTVAPTTTTT